MQALIMDKTYRSLRIIDAFSSLIWNDVYIGAGDFELEFVMDENALAYIEEDYYVSIKESDRYMIIEEIEILTSFQEGIKCRLSGRSLESILERRIIRDEIYVNGSLENSVLRLLNANVIMPSNQNRKINGFAMKTSKDPRIQKMKLEATFEAGANLYEQLCDICSERHIGFRVLPNGDGFFLFELYMGRDLTYDQTENAWVVFSPKFSNLEESDMKIDLSNLKNCMEIDFKTKRSVTDPNFDPETMVDSDVIIPMVVGDDKIGLDRRELYMTSNQEVGEIDKEKFGKPEDRVNYYDYASWEVIGFDSSGYYSALKKWHEENDQRISDMSKPIKKTVTKYKKPGDPGYVDVGDNKGAEWLNAYTEVVEETPEEAAKRNAKIVAYIAATSPRREDYQQYGWVMSDSAGYNNAIKKAQEEIDAEYRAAMEQALKYAQAQVINAALIELSDYMTITSFDGKIDPNVNFIYGKDYNLGDVVQIVNAYNFNAATRVSSVMFSHDDTNGLIVRPTFESDDAANVEFDLDDKPSKPK